MKHTPILIVLLILSVHASAQDKTTAQDQTSAQDRKVTFGLKAGANFSRMSTTINGESSLLTGFHMGVFLRTTVSPTVMFRPELYYSSQGQKTEYKSPSSGTSLGKTTTTLNYLNLPLLFEFGKQVALQFGPQIGFALSGREVGTVQSTPIDIDLKGALKSPDFSIILGLVANASSHVQIGFRYQHGLSIVIRPEGATFSYPEIQNRVFHAFMGYSF